MAGVGGGTGLIGPRILNFGVYRLGFERLVLPEDRLAEQFPGRDAQVTRRADDDIPVEHGALRAIGQEIAPDGGALG